MEYLVSGALVVAEQFIVDLVALPAGSREQLVEALADKKTAMPRHLKDSFFRTGGIVLSRLLTIGYYLGSLPLPLQLSHPGPPSPVLSCRHLPAAGPEPAADSRHGRAACPAAAAGRAQEPDACEGPKSQATGARLLHTGEPHTGE